LSTGHFALKGEYVYTRYDDAFKSELAEGESFGRPRHQLLVGVGRAVLSSMRES